MKVNINKIYENKRKINNERTQKCYCEIVVEYIPIFKSQDTCICLTIEGRFFCDSSAIK